MFSPHPLLFLLPTLLPLLVAGDCPPKSAPNIPGCWGEPGCAYVLAPGSGQECKFDYCNCGGVAAPLLPSVIGGKTSLGCGSYTTKPSAKVCPTEKPTLENGGGVGKFPGGGGGGPPKVPAQVTTGGPISTASAAFKTDAPSVTTFSYQGGALTYTKATFTSLSGQKDTKTITATVTKTQGSNNPEQTYVGPIVVGPGGIFWGPPGSAPNCIWPFCLKSGPPPPSGGKPGDSSGGGGAGGKFGCKDCAGGDGTNGKGGGSEDGGEGDDGGGEGEESGGDGGPDPPPTPEACPGARKVKRSLFARMIGNRLRKRLEELLPSTNPLKDAFTNFGVDNIEAAINSATGIQTNKFPAEWLHAYVTGLIGHFELPAKLTIGTGDNKQVFKRGDRVYWNVRWDYDPVKGPHVNAQFGSKDSSKFAYQLDKEKWQDGDSDKGKKTMQQVIQNLNKAVKYNGNLNRLKDKITWDSTEEQAIKDLKDFFKAEAKKPC